MGTKLTLTEINKQLDKKNIDPMLKKSLKDKKNIITNDKQVNK
jgi:hypothetical protein